MEEKKLNEKIGFLKSFPFLRHLSKQTLSKLTFSVQPIEFNRGNTVYHEGDKADGIYLVYKGEFEVLKRLEVKPSNTYQRFGNYGKRLVKKNDVR